MADKENASSDADRARFRDFFQAAGPHRIDRAAPTGPPRDPERLNFQRQGDEVQSGIRKEPLQPAFPSESTATTVQQTAGSSNHPFKVTVVQVEGLPRLAVYPGTMAQLYPTIDAVALNFQPRPTKSIGDSVQPFTLLLRLAVTVDGANSYRSAVSAITVVTDDEAAVVPDITGEEVPPLKMFWDDGLVHLVGHFYIPIADIDINTEGVVRVATQRLFASYSTFAVIGDEVVIIV